MTFLMEALPVASQLPRKLDVRAGDSQSHAAARANAPRNCCFGRKKKTCFDEEVLLFQGEEGKKKQAQQKAWQLAGVESDSSHRVLQMSEEILGCISAFLAPKWLFRSVQNPIAPAISVIAV